METKIYTNDLREAAETLRDGGLVAVPTETVYGLAGNGLDEKAVAEIYEVKGRPAIKPLSLMVQGREVMDDYCEAIPDDARYLADKYWPGPLTIVLKAKPIVPEIVRAGGKTVGLRCPDHELTLELLKLSAVPFAAPSANPSGEPSPKNANTVYEYFSGKIPAIVDGGECGIGLESTLIDMSKYPYRILREGALSKSEIADALIENMCIIGITGGSGSGKTTALRVLEEFGAKVIDCDTLYHELLESDAALLSALEARFTGVIKDGRLDRKALGEIVFSEPDALKALNGIAHSFVKSAVIAELRELALSGGRLAAIDAVELISGGLADICTATFAVISPKNHRIERIMQRDGISRAYAELRLSAQRNDDYYRENCGCVLENNSDLESFKLQCGALFLEVINNG